VNVIAQMLVVVNMRLILIILTNHFNVLQVKLLRFLFLKIFTY